jgi:tRNA 2-selenouridine synthase
VKAPMPSLRFPPKPGIARLPLNLAQLQAYSTIIDVRSPAEFALDHLPSAINLPVLDNEQRIEVGTLYKQVSSFAAKKVGAALVAENIARHLQTSLAEQTKNWRPLIYCWRGGSRSAALTHVLRQIGWDATQLEGGYKNWRTQVVADLQLLPTQFSFVAICGRTGSGKSRLLETLARFGQQVLDLEALAAHKGSVLGEMPGMPQPSQKLFESRIWQTLSSLNAERPVFVEAESKKIGLLQLPDALLAQMWQSQCVEVETPIALRVPLLMDEYAHLIADPPLLDFKIGCLRGLHSTERIEQWRALSAKANWPALVADLLAVHYDPAYDRSMFQNYAHIGSAEKVALQDASAIGFEAAADAMVARFSATNR